MKISSFIGHVRSRWKGFGRRMQNPSVASNGTKVGEDETEVLAGYREALCLPIDLGAAFRLRLRNVSGLSDARSSVLLGRGVGIARNQLDVSRNRPSLGQKRGSGP